MTGALLGVTRHRAVVGEAPLQMKALECGAVLFDLDGVLVDSARYVEEQWCRWALGKGLSPDPFLRVCHGRRALETIQLAAPQLNAEAEIAAFVPDTTVPQLMAIEGAGRLLGMLPASGWAVATSGSRATATARLLGAGLPLPGVLVCAEDVLHGKPSPEVYLTAAGRLRVQPADCIVVEDAPAGIEAAQAAGMRVIALTTTHPRADLAAGICARSLADVSLGSFVRRGDGALRMELLISEV